MRPGPPGMSPGRALRTKLYVPCITWKADARESLDLCAQLREPSAESFKAALVFHSPGSSFRRLAEHRLRLNFLESFWLGSLMGSDSSSCKDQPRQSHQSATPWPKIRAKHAFSLETSFETRGRVGWTGAGASMCQCHWGPRGARVVREGNAGGNPRGWHWRGGRQRRGAPLCSAGSTRCFLRTALVLAFVVCFYSSFVLCILGSKAPCRARERARFAH